ncbi:hypothetical protein ACIQBJ_14395 [Kitasatospora sp. NPDC088391]|uniref:hypothetical protein n=1 Tax=Kitasatospora sp. NPDC088391 TaxID=3364074 RepID=UPI003823B4D2
MFEARSVVRAAAGAALLTLVTAAGTLLVLMFSTDGDDYGAHRGLFGAMVFETVQRANGATGITAGVDDPVPLLVLFLVLSFVLLLVQFFFRELRQRREQLLQHQVREH